MSVTIFPNGPPANFLPELPTLPVNLTNLYGEGVCKEIIQASVSPKPERYWNLANNGFINGVHTAYSEHYHLTIRPDDVWFAILTQLNYYINAHSEEMRGQFVSFEGKKELKLIYGAASRYDVDFSILANDMSALVQENIVDHDLREWIQPSFTTTTDKDTVISSIIMMSTLQNYFKYTFELVCGLPSITLLGERSDWEKIQQKIKRLRSFGAEPTQFQELLNPILKRFIQSFIDPKDPEIIDFWQRPLHRTTVGSGEPFYSGWMTAFAFWNGQGRPLNKESIGSDDEGDSKAVKLDGVKYHQIKISDIPPGWVEAPVKINDNGKEINGVIAAGSVGMEWTLKNESVAGSVKLNSVQPVTEWWIYEKGENWKEPREVRDDEGIDWKLFEPNDEDDDDETYENKGKTGKRHDEL